VQAGREHAAGFTEVPTAKNTRIAVPRNSTASFVIIM
jgi:hypothetical protein